MNEHELFLKSHECLVDLVRWIGRPIICIPKGMASEPPNIEPGDIFLDERPIEEGLKIIRPDFNSDLLIKTFCESHLRLK